MRETLKSLAVFSASLLLILVISTGCNVNVPGCGKRSLPLFKPVLPPVQAVPAAPASTPDATQPAAAPAAAPAVAPAAVPDSAVPVAAAPISPAAETERIAYTTIEQGKWALYDMATDGSNRTLLTPPDTNSWFPLWSPNGKKLVFLSDMENKHVNLFVMDKGATSATQLTFFEDMAPPRENPLQPPLTWSPRSDQVAFFYKNQVQLVELATETVITLAQVDAAYKLEAISWVPRRDNKYVAFMVGMGEKLHSLSLVNPRLHDKIQLSEIKQTAGPFTWSSDGARLLYTVGGKDLYEVAYETLKDKALLVGATPEFGPLLETAPVDGSTSLLMLAKKDVTDSDYRVALIDKVISDPKENGTLKFLTEPGVDYASWSPDGSKILFTRDGALWVMDASGANQVKIALAGIKTPVWAKK